MSSHFALALVLAAVAAAAPAIVAPVGGPPGYRPAHAEIERELRVPNHDARSGSCGVERWTIKTGTDGGAHAVDLAHPLARTIDELRSLRAPAATPNRMRVPPAETTAFALDATLVEYRMQGDSDYRLVLRDARGDTLVAEIPDPACVAPASAFAPAIRRAREAFDARFVVTSRYKSANVPVRVVGVGFFDAPNDLDGGAPNAFELHPVVDIAFSPAAARHRP